MVEIRKLDRERPRELNLVLSSWARSWAQHAQPSLSPAQVGPIVGDHLNRCDLVLVAVPPGVERVVCGWVARAEPRLVSYVYVLHDYRRAGIATRLLLEAGIDPRGTRWRYVFGTPRMRRLCRPDPRRPDRVPWTGVPDGKEDRAARGRRVAPG